MSESTRLPLPTQAFAQSGNRIGATAPQLIVSCRHFLCSVLADTSEQCLFIGFVQLLRRSLQEFGIRQRRSVRIWPFFAGFSANFEVFSVLRTDATAFVCLLRSLGSRMMKATVAYSLVCLGFIALVLFSNQPHRQKMTVHRNLHPGRRLVVRKLPFSPDAKHEHVAFDPIVANLERTREERTWEREHFQQQYQQWSENDNAAHHDVQRHPYSAHLNSEGHNVAPHPESQPEPESWDYSDPEDYLNDEDRFNISSRIITLFPMIDSSPPDGIISLAELQDWHLQAALTEAKHRTDRQMEIYDKNHDGMISFSEYLPQVSSESTANDTMERGGVGWWKGQFDAADEDGDGLLNHTEFNNFLHPQDSQNERLHQWLRKQEIKDRDHDNDSKISFSEFLQGLYDLIRLYDEEDSLPTPEGHDFTARREAHAKQKFVELDKDKDGFLSEDELIPIMDKLHPGEGYYTKQQSEYLMAQADINKDGHLTLEEMLENPYVFYSTAYAHEDYEEYFHDEF